MFMEEKITLEELVTKRIRLSMKEYSDLMFHLEVCVETYKKLRKINPQYNKQDEYDDKYRKMDYLDFGHLVLWGRTMMYCCNKIVRKAHARKNIVGDKKGYTFVTYSKEEGLRQRAADGKIYDADPIELML